MKKLIHQINLIRLFSQITFSAEWQYRFNSLAWIVNGSITPLLLMSIWIVVSGANKLALSQNQIVTYYFLSIILNRVSQVWSLEDVGDDIVKGDFSIKIVKPYNYLIEQIGTTIGRKILRLLTMAPVVIFLFIFLRSQINLDLNISTIFLFILAAALGLAMRFLFENLLGTFVFFLEEYVSMEHTNYIISDIFSGALIPLALLPTSIHSFLLFTPFRFYISFPIEIIQKQISSFEIMKGFSVCIFFLISLYLLHKLMFKKGLRKYTSFGK